MASDNQILAGRIKPVFMNVTLVSQVLQPMIEEPRTIIEQMGKPVSLRLKNHDIKFHLPQG